MADDLYATLNTSAGPITIKLFENHAPRTVENFVGLAEGTREWTDPRTGKTEAKKAYDGTVFHRVIKGFMIQGGDPTGTGIGDLGFRFADEFHPDLSYNRPYLLGMANEGPDSNQSQFFVTVRPTRWLNKRHAIFGEVADEASRKVVSAINKTRTDARDRPVESIVIHSVTIDRRSAGLTQQPVASQPEARC